MKQTKILNKDKLKFTTALIFLCMLIIPLSFADLSTELIPVDNTLIKNNLYQHVEFGCNSIDAPDNELCLKSDEAGVIMYDYDDFNNVNRRIVIDNYINHFPNPSFKYTSGNLGKIFKPRYSPDLEISIEKDSDALSFGNNLKMKSLDSTNSDQSIESEFIYVRPNTNYTFSYYIKKDSGASNINTIARVRCYDDVELDTTNDAKLDQQYSLRLSGISDSWQRHSLSFTTGSDVIACNFIILAENLGNDQSVYVDNIQVENGNSATEFFSANTFITDYYVDNAANVQTIVNPGDVYSTYTHNIKGDPSYVDINNAIVNGYAKAITQNNDQPRDWFGKTIIEVNSPDAVKGNNVFKVPSDASNPASIISSKAIVRPYLNYNLSLAVNIPIVLDVLFYTSKHQYIEGSKKTIYKGTTGSMNYVNEILRSNDIPLNARYAELDIRPFDFSDRSVMRIDDVSLVPYGKKRAIIENELTLTGMMKKLKYVDTSKDIETTFEYDISDRIKNILTIDNQDVLFNESYDYDLANNLITINNFGELASIDYDNMHRITKFDSSPNFFNLGSSFSINWSYDTRGNVQSLSEDSTVRQFSYQGNTNRLSNDDIYSYTYTNFGAISKKTNSNTGNEILYRYDKDRKLKQVVTNGPKVEYYYLNGKVQRTVINDAISKINIYGPNNGLLYTADFGGLGAQICNVGDFNDDGKTFSVIDQAQTKAKVDDRGFMILSGTINTNQGNLNDLTLPGSKFELIGNNSEIVAVIDEQGDLYLAGSIETYVNNIVPNGNNNFIIRKSDDNVFKVDSAGNLQLKGCVAESAEEGSNIAEPPSDPQPPVDPISEDTPQGYDGVCGFQSEFIDLRYVQPGSLSSQSDVENALCQEGTYDGNVWPLSQGSNPSWTCVGAGDGDNPSCSATVDQYQTSNVNGFSASISGIIFREPNYDGFANECTYYQLNEDSISITLNWNEYQLDNSYVTFQGYEISSDIYGTKEDLTGVLSIDQTTITLSDVLNLDNLDTDASSWNFYINAKTDYGDEGAESSIQLNPLSDHIDECRDCDESNADYCSTDGGDTGIN